MRQLSDNEGKAGREGRGGGGMMNVEGNDEEDCRINNGMRRKRSMDEVGEGGRDGGVGGGGMALQPQRVRCFGGNPFTDMTNHD